MLNLQALEQAFSSISHVGKGTIVADIHGTPVTLEALLPHEEVAVQKYAAVALEENKDALSANTEFLDRFQVALLSYAVARIGDMNLKADDHIETGETLPNGVKVKVPRVDAVRGVVSQWSRTVRQYLFGKYSELMDRLELESETLIKYDPFDLDAEIKRTEARLEDLKGRKAEKESEKEVKHPFRQQVAAFAKASVPDLSTPAPAPQAQPEPPAPTPTPTPPQVQPQAATPPPPAPQPRKPIIPTAAPPPPAAVATPMPAYAQEPSMDEVLDGIEDDQQGIGLDDLQAQVAAENDRLLRARQAQQQVAQQQPILRRPPPHASIHMDVDEEDNTSVQKVGDVGGTEAYRIGQVPTLTEKSTMRNGQGVAINQSSDKGTQNPRFRRG